MCILAASSHRCDNVGDKDDRSDLDERHRASPPFPKQREDHRHGAWVRCPGPTQELSCQERSVRKNISSNANPRLCVNARRSELMRRSQRLQSTSVRAVRREPQSTGAEVGSRGLDPMPSSRESADWRPEGRRQGGGSSSEGGRARHMSLLRCACSDAAKSS